MIIIRGIFIGLFVAVFMGSGAFADIVAKTNIVSGDNVTVSTPTNGANAGKIVISATDTTYSTGTGTTAGVTKLYTSTGINTDGAMTQKAVTEAISGLDSTSSGTGAVVTDVSQTDGKVTVTKGNVKIPVGGQNATTYAAVWIE